MPIARPVKRKRLTLFSEQLFTISTVVVLGMLGPTGATIFSHNGPKPNQHCFGRYSIGTDSFKHIC